MTDTAPDLRRPRASADLFHAIPSGSSTRSCTPRSGAAARPTVSVLDADKVAALGVEMLDPYALGADELLGQGSAATTSSSRSRCAPAASWAWSTRSCRPSSRSPSPTTCAPAGSCSRSTPSAFVAAPARQDAAQLDGIRARPEGGRRGDGVAAS